MTILLINPPTESRTLDRGDYPMGLLYLSAVLEKKNYNVIVKDYYSGSWDKSITNMLNDIKMKVISVIPD